MPIMRMAANILYSLGSYPIRVLVRYQRGKTSWRWPVLLQQGQGGRISTLGLPTGWTGGIQKSPLGWQHSLGCAGRYRVAIAPVVQWLIGPCTTALRWWAEAWAKRKALLMQMWKQLFGVIRRRDTRSRCCCKVAGLAEQKVGAV